MHGGELIASFLKAQGVTHVFTLCGGHISPILAGCKNAGIRIIDVRHEATAAFAADATARLTGVPGVAVVTAGPGVTNTITAIQNASLAQSPMILLGGATATALKGRGALQDIDQLKLIKPLVKWATSVSRVKDLIPVLEKAFHKSLQGIPGPVFVECPVDLLYDETLVKDWYGVQSSGGRTIADRFMRWYLQRHVERLFRGVQWEVSAEKIQMPPADPPQSRVRKAADVLRQAKRPVMIVGSQTVVDVARVERISQSLGKIGIPVYLSGMARGLLGKHHPLHMRHKRREALREADVVILLGTPMDFRLNYGRHIPRGAYLISVNRNGKEGKMNRRPNLFIKGDAGKFITLLASIFQAGENLQGWIERLQNNEAIREAEIRQQANEPTKYINPLKLCLEIEKHLDENSTIIADGGDFVATASYILRPPRPLSWLDPGVFGTLGVGAGFAMAAALAKPHQNVWLLYGDGALGFSLSEFDTFVRHQIPLIAVVGNDAGWTQIAREQVELLHDDVATRLNYADYHRVAEALGGKGILVQSEEELPHAFTLAKQYQQEGFPVLINAHIGQTTFRKGSISM